MSLCLHLFISFLTSSEAGKVVAEPEFITNYQSGRSLPTYSYLGVLDQKKWPQLEKKKVLKVNIQYIIFFVHNNKIE
jgi:hypothetical protein